MDDHHIGHLIQLGLLQVPKELPEHHDGVISYF